MGDDAAVLLKKLEELQNSIDNALKDLRELESANRIAQVKFWVVGVLFVGILFLTLYAWSSARDARENLAERFEQSQVETCESTQDARVRLRGVFQLLFSQAAASSDNPEEVQEFAKEFNDAVLKAVPNRDCAQEARDRQRQNG